MRQAVERLAREKLLCDLTLELETVSAVFSHGLSSFESPAARSIAKLNPVRPKGPTPSRGQFCTPKHTGADWRFTTTDARIKLKSLYPSA